MLPHVCEVMYDEYNDDETRWVWAGVNRHLQSFAAVDQTLARGS